MAEPAANPEGAPAHAHQFQHEAVTQPAADAPALAQLMQDMKGMREQLNVRCPFCVCKTVRKDTYQVS